MILKIAIFILIGKITFAEYKQNKDETAEIVKAEGVTTGFKEPMWISSFGCLSKVAKIPFVFFEDSVIIY